MRALLWWVLSLLVAGCHSQAPPEQPIRRPKAVVLITIDTWRADALSFARGGPVTTPFLDSLASTGTVFTRAYSTSSWTAPAMASLMTGMWPQSHGVRRGRVGGLGTNGAVTVLRQPILSDSFAMLAEKLKQARFGTIGVAANMHLSGTLGFAQGFDRYFGDGFVDATDVNARAIRFLREQYGEAWRTRWRVDPTFLWLHYFDPHMPYEARKPWIQTYAPDFAAHPQDYPTKADAPELLRKYLPATVEKAAPLLALYRSEVRYVDEQIRKLNDEIHFDDPEVLLIVTADHGEELGEHGGLGHAATLYEEVVRVPLFVRWPAALPGGRVVEQPVSLVDLYPTIVDLVGGDSRVQGRLLPLRREGEPPPRPLLMQTDRARPPLEGVVDGSWKLIRPSSNRTSRELYDLASDPAERIDRPATDPAVSERLAGFLDRELGALPPPPSDAEYRPLGDAAAVERLRALGYE